MKTAGRKNPNHGATLPHNRAHGAVGQNRSRSIRGAAKQEKFQPKEVCFFLTSPFIELIRTWLSKFAVSNSSPYGQNRQIDSLRRFQWRPPAASLLLLNLSPKRP